MKPNRGKIMTAQILVPLGTNDRTEEIIRSVEKVARPGMKVVFLLPSPVGGPRYSFHTDLFLLPRVKEMMNYYSWEGNLQRARRKLSSACEILRPRGVEVGVDVYTGSLKKAIRSHVLDGDVHLIMTRAGGFSQMLLIQPPIFPERSPVVRAA